MRPVAPPRPALSRSVLAAFVVLLAGGLAACRDGHGAGDGDAGRPATDTGPAAALAELPVPRTEVAGAAWRGRLAVGGGLTADGGASARVHLYDAGADRWEPAPDLPVPLHHAALAVVGERLFVVGGYTNGPGQAWLAQAGVLSLGAGEEAWRAEAPLPGGPRGALGAAAAGGVLVVAGGESGGGALGRTEVYDPAARSWRTGPDLATPREHLAVAASGGRVYAVAGRAAGRGNLRAVESLDPAADRAWRAEPEVAHPRGGIGAAAPAGRLCVAGGEEAAGTIASVECLDGERWVDAGRLARPRHGLAVMALGGRLHTVAGGEQPGLFVSGAHEALDVGG